MVGGFCHVEIKVSNMTRAKKFYGKLFGWKFEHMGPGYALIKTKEVGGALDLVKSVPKKSGTRVYIEVKSIDATLKAASKMKCKTVMPATEIGGNHGSMAIFIDSEGNEVGLWSK